MELIAQHNGKEVWFEELKRPYIFNVHFSDEKFVCAIFANDPTISVDEQNTISNQIIKSTCRYAVCAGYKCSSWDDSIDFARITNDPNFSPPDEDFVMTTWHENETVAEVLWFALTQTDFDENKFKKYLVLFIGAEEKIKIEVKNAIQETITEDWKGFEEQ